MRWVIVAPFGRQWRPERERDGRQYTRVASNTYTIPPFKIIMNITNINSASAPKAAGGYSQGVVVSNAQRLLFISGQIPETSTGHVPEGFPAQARLVWHNVLAQLGEAGMAVSNLVKVTTFLSSREFAVANREIRREILGPHCPALTVIIAGIFDEKWLLEIEAVAAQ